MTELVVDADKAQYYDLISLQMLRDFPKVEERMSLNQRHVKSKLLAKAKCCLANKENVLFL